MSGKLSWEVIEYIQKVSMKLNKIKITMPSIICLTLVFLSSCTNPARLRQQPPEFELISDRTAKDVAICIAERWENKSALGTYPISFRPRTDGYTVFVTTVPTVFVDIIKTPGGSLIRYFRSAIEFVDATSEIEECVGL